MNPLFNAIYSGDLEIFKLIFNVVPSYPNRYEDTSFGSIDELAYAKLLGKTEIINFLEEISVKRLDVSDESNKPNELIIKKEDLFSELVLQLRDYKAKSEKILNGISIVVNSDIDSIYCMLSDNKDLVKENHKVLEWEFSLSSESLNYFNKRLSNSSEFIDNIYRENPKYNRLHFIYECLANLKIQSDFIGIEFYIFCDDSYNGLDKKILEYNEKLK
jgi:hypothetical protein